ncbi:MAG: hypothetical protein HY901_08920, partial [Deltaproteobacteria bacterium]|nr:hypothetical protein [Deltaproteobacteria bacterium]
MAFSPSARAGQPAVVVSSRINGLYAGLGCRQGPEPVLSMVAGHFAAEPDALPIDAGDLLGASAVARLAVERDADALALAIAATGLRAAGMGHRDLSAHRSTLLRFLKALRAQGIRHVVSNLECDADHRPLCDQVEDASDPPLLLETPGGKVALLVFVAPELLEDLPPDRAEGLTLIPLEDAVPLEIARARAAGAVRLVLVVDPPPGGELAAAVQASSRAGDEDLVVARELPEPVV